MQMTRAIRLAVVVASATAFSAISPALSQDEGATIGQRGDREWVRLTGTVEEVMPESFRLDYGGNSAIVEVDGFRAETDFGLKPDDRVQVTGTVDDGVWEKRTIEASSVFVENRSEIVYASPIDEEGGRTTVPAPGPLVEAEVGITGKVTAVDPDAETLTLDLGRETMEVDLSDLTRMPALEAGQRVSVVGESEGVDVFEARALKAKTVTVLSQG